MINVLFAASECYPYAKSGGLGDVVYALPKALTKEGISPSVILPLYENTEATYGRRLTFVKAVTVELSWRKAYAGLFKLKDGGVTYYFIDNKQYFGRNGLYGYYDDGERFAFFSKAVLSVLPLMDAFPSIIHCNDWQTALIPMYLKTGAFPTPAYERLRTVFTIHNIEYQGKYDLCMLGDVLGVDEKHKGIAELGGCLNYMKAAIVTCDSLTTVSPTYAEEITYGFYGRGLEDIINQNAYKLTGILNGIDTELYNPATDKSIYKTYSKEDMSGKKENKRALLAELGMTYDEAVPLIGMVTRLAEHKGIGMVQSLFQELTSKNIQFVLLGTGDRKYEDYFNAAKQGHKDNVRIITAFSGPMANRIYAASDMFLMPSVSEPCGLSQMIALRYGSVPIVRETGGLRDSVSAFSPIDNKGNGITFATVNAHDMLYAVTRGLEYYGKKALWSTLVENAMNSRNSWTESARKYVDIYKRILKG